MGLVHKASFLALMLLLTVPFSNAQSFTVKSLDIVFDIQDDGTVRQSMVFALSSPSSEPIEYGIGNNARDIAVLADNEELDYDLVEEGSGNILNIVPGKPVQELTISFVAYDVVFKKGPISHFFAEFSFGQDIGSINARAILPPGSGLHESAFLPPNGRADTDGKRIMVVWDSLDANSLFFSVKFVPVKSNGNAWFFVALVLAISFMAVFLYSRGRRHDAMLLGFMEDEKRAISFIQHNKNALQKDLQREFGFSRAKATRIVKKLESKGMIEKEEFGRTNRLRWKA